MWAGSPPKPRWLKAWSMSYIKLAALPALASSTFLPSALPLLLTCFKLCLHCSTAGQRPLLALALPLPLPRLPLLRLLHKLCTHFPCPIALRLLIVTSQSSFSPLPPCFATCAFSSSTRCSGLLLPATGYPLWPLPPSSPPSTPPSPTPP